MNRMYDHQQIETKWMEFWEKNQLFQHSERQEVADPADKEYLLFAFSYPSGSGLHVGHVESKTALDILARYHRMHGKQVFFPVGWDAFGLPAENYAIKTGVPPAETTKTAIDTFRRQVKRVGISYDWANEIATCHPGYYQWTQWLFLKLYEAGLAFRQGGMVNWCPSCQTVLANEQVVNGLCERCDHQVIQKEMEQWFFKITEYKDQLIDDLDQVDWPEPTKQQQIHWIGRSTGVEVDFALQGTDQHLKCFTTRVDTIGGVTFVVVSPETYSELGLANVVAEQAAERSAAVDAYINQAQQKTEEERQIGEKNKTGVETGLQVTNPVTGADIPVYVADYVLGSYGTGTVMGVPAHDERDWAFAKKYELPIIPVVVEEGTSASEAAEAVQDQPYSMYGTLINTDGYDGLSSKEAQEQIPADFSDQMQPTTTYRLRDWLISRQRYWGAPIPIVYDPEGTAHPVKEEALPWTLPTDVDFKPTGESPLHSSEEFQARTEAYAAEAYADLIAEKGWDASGKGWRPEYDTMDTFVDSSWYFMRYVDARNEAAFADPDQLKKWLPVDFYMIGPEHIVLHLLYARFFTKFLRDQGYFSFDEPFMKMRHQGMILGPDGKKMSKSKGNVISPDDIVEKFGADTLRVYEMFMGPIDADKPWDIRAVAGVYRFLNRLYDLVLDWDPEAEIDESFIEVRRKIHQTIRKVSSDIPEVKFNTAIAAMMECVNTWSEHEGRGVQAEDVMAFIKILAPFAPFMADELYHTVEIPDGEKKRSSIHLSEWPAWDDAIATEDTVTIAVQVNGKVRDQLEIPAETVEDADAVVAAAKELEKISGWLEGKEVVKEIYIPGRIVNVVVR